MLGQSWVPDNKGMEQTSGALAEMEAPFAAYPRCLGG